MQILDIKVKRIANSENRTMYDYSPDDLWFDAKGKLQTNNDFEVTIQFTNEKGSFRVVKFIVPKTLESDGASTPLGIGKARSKLAAYIHDWLTRTKINYGEFGGIVNGHKIFRHILINHHGYSKFRANIWYVGVLLFGWIFWQPKLFEYNKSDYDANKYPSRKWRC